MGQCMSTRRRNPVDQAVAFNQAVAVDQAVNQIVPLERNTTKANRPKLINLDKLYRSTTDLQSYECINPKRFLVDNQLYGEFRCKFEIAQGRFGVVYLLEKGEDRLVFKCARQKESLLPEALILSKIDSKFVVEFKGFYELSNGFALAMGYSVNGNVKEFINHCKVEKNLSLCNDALRALQFLHGLKLAHFDIKPEHMLIGISGRLILSGFSSCKKLEEHENMQGYIGTELYWSPQHFLDLPYRHAADVIAMTHSIIEIMFGVHIFKQCISEDHSISIGSLVCDYPRIVDMLKEVGMSDEWVRVLSKSFRLQEGDRPSVEDLINLMVIPMMKRTVGSKPLSNF